MTILKFKCKLLSDIIINTKAASEGQNDTLDFIPGSNFLGIVASRYADFGNDALEIFHSGKVRFGDAHPANKNSRTLRIPAAMFYPKLLSASKECYIHHCIPDLKSPILLQKQLKQCRGGFYDFSSTQSEKVETHTNYSIKSAYDNESRRSEDSKMFGYKSLEMGLILYFSVEVDNDNLAAAIKASLIGKKRVGRSRTAQYGLVEIEEFNYNTIDSQDTNSEYKAVYAESRLIFLDQYGLATFQPTPQQLGFSENSEICWDKSQIRTFQYSPWNFHRKCFDTDRCGIEKGSVIIVKAKETPKQNYIGSYKNEGFGKVIYNPPFLTADSNGEAKYKPTESEKTKTSPVATAAAKCTSPLLKYLSQQAKTESNNQFIYKTVNEWVNKNSSRFKGDTFASQWGTIRSIAMQTSNLDQLKDNLYKKDTGYLTHGVAKDKWEENRRLSQLKQFIETDLKQRELTGKEIQQAVINLSAEMAKRCNIKKHGGENNDTN